MITQLEMKFSDRLLVPFPLNKFNFFSYVIPDLIRNPGSKTRIPAFAGMTKCETNFLETALGNCIRAYEVWSISNKHLSTEEIWLAPVHDYNSDDFALDIDGGEFDFDTVLLLDDIQHGIYSIVSLASQHIPELISLYKALVNEINGQISILRELSKVSRTLSESKTECCSVNELKKQENNEKKINVVTDFLIQIDSVLAYVLSQSFGGSTPILHNQAYIHSHSLLGTGTATNALNAFTLSVEAAFRSTPVYEAVKRAFSTGNSINVFRHLDEVDVEAWDSERAEMDLMISKLELHASDYRPHMMFFSSRLGFQEAPFSISAAIQSIPAADSVRWSLMTLSHEVMHAHVRDLLSAIFSAYRDGQSVEESLAQSYCEYSEFINSNNRPPNRLESLRFALFNYCRFRRFTEEMAREEGTTAKAEDVFPDADDLFVLFKEYYRDMNEIIVHVLDLNYFYSGDYELYIDYLWLSWATVPSVLANPAHYLLRTIASVSPLVKGSLNEKYEKSVDIIERRLVSLSTRMPSALSLID